jgi:hypothetical protein
MPKAFSLQVIDLPTLPPNARYIFHSNECFDWGTFGWALSTQAVELSKYKYFIFMNSSIRGPFLPAYIKVLNRCRRAGLLVQLCREQTQLIGSPTLQGMLMLRCILV